VKLHFVVSSDVNCLRVQGGELFTRLNVIHRLPEDIARFYAAEIVLVFEHLHASDILYRDLKPENILLNHDGHLCLTDFGMAKQLDGENASSNTFCGTVEYMSPEVVNGTQYGKEADWWALGGFCDFENFVIFLFLPLIVFLELSSVDL
jgi:serine/threonine protein kinase